MAVKVTFDPSQKLIICKSGVISLDIRTDVYSDGKEDWTTEAALNKFLFPVEAIGGQPLPGSKVLGTTYFLNYGWRIRPQEADHTLLINGNLYTDTGDSPFVPTVGSFNAFIVQQVSNLVDSTVAQLPEIEHASFNGGVTVDEANGTAGTAFPAGTPRYPVDNLADALDICAARGFDTFFIVGDILVDSGLDFSDMIFVGQSKNKSTLTIHPDANVARAEFYECHLAGTLDGDALAKDCLLDNINYISGFVESCVLDAGVITLGGNAAAHFLDCYSGVPGQDTPVIDCGGSGQALALRNYNGGVALRNKTGPEAVSIDLNSGQVILEPTITNGDIIIRGVGELIDNSNGDSGLTIINNAISNTEVANTVWENDDGLAVLSDLAFIKGIEGGRWVMSGSEMIFYDDDNVTELARFDISYNTENVPIERTRT